MAIFNKTFAEELSSIQSTFTSALEKAKSLQTKLSDEKKAKQESIKSIEQEIADIDDLTAKNQNFVDKLTELVG